MRKIKAILVIALCIIAIAFGVYEQYKSIKTGEPLAEVISGMGGRDGKD